MNVLNNSNFLSNNLDLFFHIFFFFNYKKCNNVMVFLIIDTYSIELWFTVVIPINFSIHILRMHILVYLSSPAELDLKWNICPSTSTRLPHLWFAWALTFWPLRKLCEARTVMLLWFRWHLICGSKNTAFQSGENGMENWWQGGERESAETWWTIWKWAGTSILRRVIKYSNIMYNPTDNNRYSNEPNHTTDAATLDGFDRKIRVRT